MTDAVETRRRAPAPILDTEGRTIYNLKGKATSNDADEILQSIQRGDVSQQIVDPFKTGSQSLYGEAGDLRIVAPPISLPVLLRMPNDSSILRQCIEAMVINVEGHGYRLEYVGPDGSEQSDEAAAEAVLIEELLTHINPDISVIEMRKRTRWDIETLGFGFWEVGRSRDDKPSFVTHLPAHTVRFTTVDPTPVQVEVETTHFGSKTTTSVRRYFRRFVQIVGANKIYFKEIGDPRSIDPATGQVDDTLPYEQSATEVIPFVQYYPGQVYGLPRWFNNLIAVQTGRQAELTNLDYFKDNAIPALAILVSGGMLSTTNINQIEEHVTAARGRQSQNRVMILEALSDPNAAPKDGTIPPPKIEIKPLAGERPKEGMFLELGKDCNDKVRSSFRLPPIFTGHAQDYSHASAKTSYEVAEGQVFGPERAVMDEALNRQVLAPYGVKFWAIRSNPPKIADPAEILDAIETFDMVGAMSPNIAIGLANEVFGLDIPLIEDEWGEFPFAIVQGMATAGTLEGLDEITKEVDAATAAAIAGGKVDANGKPIAGQVPAADEPKEGDSESAKIEKQRRRAIRRTIGQLSDVLTTNNHARYKAAPRRRSGQRRAQRTIQSKAA